MTKETKLDFDVLTGGVHASPSVELEGNDLMWQFVREVESSPVGTNIPAFWEKQQAGVRRSLTQPSQAAIVAAARNGMLFCKGKPGDMTFYTSSGSSVLDPLFKINGVFKVAATFLFMWVFVIGPLAGLNSAKADLILTVVGLVMLIGYTFRAFLYAGFRPLLAYLPAHDTNLALTAKTGFYWMGMATSAGLLFAMYFRHGDQSAGLGWFGLIPAYVEAFLGQIWLVVGGAWGIPDVFTESFWLGMILVMFPVLIFVPAFLMGSFVSMGGHAGAYKMLVNSGMLERYAYDPTAAGFLNYQPRGMILGILLSLYFILVGVFWVDEALLGVL